MRTVKNFMALAMTATLFVSLCMSCSKDDKDEAENDPYKESNELCKKAVDKSIIQIAFANMYDVVCPLQNSITITRDAGGLTHYYILMRCKDAYSTYKHLIYEGKNVYVLQNSNIVSLANDICLFEIPTEIMEEAKAAKSSFYKAFNNALHYSEVTSSDIDEKLFVSQLSMENFFKDGTSTFDIAKRTYSESSLSLNTRRIALVVSNKEVRIGGFITFDSNGDNGYRKLNFTSGTLHYLPLL